MIITVTPNPSVDRTVAVDALHRGAVHRAEGSRLDPGGKGVNVARALAAAGRSTVAVLPAGGPEGSLLGRLLVPQGVDVAAVPIGGATRTNLTLVEPDGTTTKINEPGPELSPAEADHLTAEVVRLLPGADWLVCAGSLPRGVDEDFYAGLVTLARRSGVRVAVDTSGLPLAAACAAGPDLLKPNLAELAELVGRPLTSLGAVITATREVCGDGAVLVSLGSEGALLADGTNAVHARSTVPVAVRSTVGAGDAALAGFLIAGGLGATAVRSAVAYGSAAVAQPGSAMPGPSDVHPDLVERLEFDGSLALTGEAA